MLRDAFLAIGVIVVLCGASLMDVRQNATSVYVAYSLVALLAFGLELADGVNVRFIFIILALPRLTWGVTMAMAACALLLQVFARSRRPSPEALIRAIASTALAVLAAQAAFQAPVRFHVAEPVRLMLASVACFLAYHPEWQKRNLWRLPYYLVSAAIAAICPVPIALIPMLLLMWLSYRVYERRLIFQNDHSGSVERLRLRTIEALTQALEAKGQPLSSRSRRVQIYAVEMAREMELSPDHIDAIRAASLLYDIGERAVPDPITSKRGAHAPEELEKVKTHSEAGAGLLEFVRFPYPVAPIVCSHHERWDGTGYPNGLKGDDIPIGARILAAVDALDALASPGAHRAAMSLDAAFQRVEADSGTAYDPNVIAVLRKRYTQWEKVVAAREVDSAPATDTGSTRIMRLADVPLASLPDGLHRPLGRRT